LDQDVDEYISDRNTSIQLLKYKNLVTTEPGPDF
jgi:hypothetical protein